MALTSAQQNDLFKLTVGLFNAAPGSFYTEVEGIVIGSGTPANAAQTLINTAAFQAILPSNILTSTQFSTKFLDMLVGSTVSDANKAWAVAQMDAKLNAGETQGAVAWWAIDELSKVPTTHADWGMAAATLLNKVDVAKYFTVDQYVASNSIATLQGLLIDVTNLPSSVDTAKASAVASGIALTTAVGETAGTSGNDTFKAFLANGANTLQSGDTIRGGAGTDTLIADVSTQGTGENAVAFTSQSVEKVTLRAQHSNNDYNNSDNNLESSQSSIDAERAAGVNTWENNNSRADLVIEDVRIGAGQITKDITIAMVETDPGNVDFGVYFDQLSLRNTASSSSVVNIQLMDTGAAAAAATSATPLLNNPYDTFKFYANGNLVSLVLPNAAAADTYAALLTAFQSAIANAGLSNVVTASLGSNFTVTDPISNVQVTGTAITLNAAGGYAITTPAGSGWFNTTGASVPATSNIYTTYNTSSSSSAALVTSTIILDDVGRGSTGGDLVVGGLSVGETSTSRGVERFEIEVRDNSKLQTINSTNDALREVTIKNGVTSSTSNAYVVTTANAGDLTVNGNVTESATIEGGAAGTTDNVLPGLDSLHHGAYGFTNVRLIDASTMTGKLAFNAQITDAAIAKYVNLVDTAASPTADVATNNTINSLGINVAYTGGTNNDTMTVAIDGDVAASRSLAVPGLSDFTFNVAGADGDDSITVSLTKSTLNGGVESWANNQDLNNNITIDGGAGNDVIRKPGAGDTTIDAGAGNDVIYTDNTGSQTQALSTPISNPAGKAAWVFNTVDQVTTTAGQVAFDARDLNDLRSDVNTSYNLFKSTVYVTFKGLQSSTVTVSGTGYKTTNLELNQAIKNAINTDATLKNLLVAKDGPANTLVVESLIDGAMVASDLAVTIEAPATTILTTTEVAGAAAAYGLAVGSTEAQVLTAMGTAVTLLGTNQDYTSALATNNNSAAFMTGANSSNISDNFVTAGSGDDIVVLGTRDGTVVGDSSNEVVTFASSFGNDVIVNFDATAGVSRDHLDFSAFLGTTAVSFGALASTDSLVTVVAETAANDTAAEIKALVDALGQPAAGVTNKQVYVAYSTVAASATDKTKNVGKVYSVTNGSATGDAVVTLEGTIDLADTDWATLTVENFQKPSATAEGASTIVTQTLTATGNNQTLVGSALNDVFNTAGFTGTTMNGNGGSDTFTVAAGATGSIISDLDTGDVVTVAAGADVTANNVSAFVATAGTTNAAAATDFTINSLAAGSTVNMAAAGGTVGFELVGGAGVDTLTGSANADTITGGADDDTITGGADDDTITGGADDDTITGGVGNDTINVDAGTDTITDLATGDILNVSAAATAIANDVAAFVATAATANAGTATLNSVAAGSTISMALATGANGYTLVGGAGVDTLTGSGFADAISTGAGATNTVAGGAGLDTITLGAGTDTVSFTGVAVAANRDTIAAFTVGTDVLGLDVDYTTAATAAGALAVVEDEAVAAANANGAAYDLGALTAGNTNALDLVTLDTATLTNLANADLSLATDGAELLKALVAVGGANTATGIQMDNIGDSLYIAVDDGANGYLYIANSGADNLAAAAEITLVGTFTSSLIDGVVAAQTIMVG